MSFLQCLADAIPALAGPTGRLTVEAAEAHAHVQQPEHAPAPHPCACMCEPPAYPGTPMPALPTYVPRYKLPEMDAKLAALLKDVSATIESEVRALSADLRRLSMSMWHNPELQWKEYKTSDLFASYFQQHLAQEGWTTTRHAYGIETAFECVYQFTPAGHDGAVRCIGFQSELDALPGIGQGCGHNLIAISGVASAVSLARACKAHNVPVKIVLLGTPAEEGGGGKISLIEAGAYDQMHVCLMCHPALMNTVTPMLAVQALTVHFKGKTSHAGAAPWQGINALDAAVLAYTNISAMRQQLPPTARVHGIIEGHNMAPNVIPDDVDMHYNVRGPTAQDVKSNLAKVIPCFEAAAKATGCSYSIDMTPMYYDVWPCPGLKESFESIMSERYGMEFTEAPFTASTDFGNVSYTLPALHPAYHIDVGDHPEEKGNHTIGFTHAAKTLDAHRRTLEICVGLAALAAKVVIDQDFYDQVRTAWQNEMGDRNVSSHAVAHRRLE